MEILDGAVHRHSTAAMAVSFTPQSGESQQDMTAYVLTVAVFSPLVVVVVAAIIMIVAVVLVVVHPARCGAIQIVRDV